MVIIWSEDTEMDQVSFILNIKFYHFNSNSDKMLDFVSEFRKDG